MKLRLVVIALVVVTLGVLAALPSETEDNELPNPTVPAPRVKAPAPIELEPSVDASVVEVAPYDAGVVLETLLEIDAGITTSVDEQAIPAAPDSGHREAAAPNDPRFGERWNKPGLCGDETYASLQSRREALLASFITVQRGGTQVHRHRDVPVAVANMVGHALDRARMVTTQLLGSRADVSPPEVFIYASNEQLRDVACTTPSAVVGYYDGAIHLPGDDADAVRTVLHEFMHHALNSLGIRKPMWLHEGLAMYAADERWWEDPRLGLTAWLANKHLPFPAMAEAFPHTADELFAGAAYYQSFEMVRFVGTGHRNFAWLIEGLASHAFTERRLFEEAIGLDGVALENAWQRHVTTTATSREGSGR